MQTFPVRWAWVWAGCLCLAWCSAGLFAADPNAIQEAIRRGADALVAGAGDWNDRQTMSVDQGTRSLAALALLKAKVPANHPVVASVVDSVVARSQGEYRPGAHHYYQAGVDANLLVEAGGENYRNELATIASYVIAGQLSHGGWDYPEGHNQSGTTTYSGDTSVTQYAMLALWAATRAGVEVPNSVFENSIRWHMQTQLQDGGFAYCPGTTIGVDQGLSTLNMTAAGMGSILIGALHLYPNQYDQMIRGTVRNEPRQEEAVSTSRAGGRLERVNIDTPPDEAAARSASRGSLPITQVQQSVQRAYGWLGPRFVNFNNHAHAMYYYYAVERAGALGNFDTIGNQNWYDFCADHLLSTQNADGTWQADRIYKWRDTAFAIMFLTRSTATIIRRTPVDPAGAGLLAGGRGLPENLDDVEMRDGRVTVPPKLGPTSDLLSSLQNIGEINISEVQEALVEQVQIGDRSLLIGQKDRLMELARHPDPEVRRTVIWALGRTGDMSLAKLLIEALEDPFVGVNIEANNALCWISRRPNGFGLATDPLGSLPENATQEQKDAVMAAWRAEAVRSWGSWYLRHRPFADRGDEFEAELRQRLGR